MPYVCARVGMTGIAGGSGFAINFTKAGDCGLILAMFSDPAKIQTLSSFSRWQPSFAGSLAFTDLIRLEKLDNNWRKIKRAKSNN